MPSSLLVISHYFFY
uniref:Uncharacterized protein n=1 Tax=Anguilla anguilla TaxID=7936 RepID=A0A0E9VN00_ANGAN